MSLGYYPGCSLKGTSREYNESVVAVAKACKVALQEINDWNCCGATAAHNMNKALSLALPARILALAQEQNIHEILVPCASCYNRLATVLHELHENPSLKDEVAQHINKPLDLNVKIINVIQFLEKYIIPFSAHLITKPFSRKVACYYGCLLVRPNRILEFDREEDPISMDQMMTSIGAEPIDWAYKTECCGAGLSVSQTSSVTRLSGKILEDAIDRGAETIIVACPMCHSNLDMRQKAIIQTNKIHSQIPVLYITQAIGLALGVDPKTLGIHRHFVKAENY